MATTKVTPNQIRRLDSIARHLQLESRWPDREFLVEVRGACLKAAGRVFKGCQPECGENACQALAHHYGVRFEEVHGPEDIQRLKREYLERQRELGFARLDEELIDKNVDALLFRRTKTPMGTPFRHIAVLNLQQGTSRAFWNRFHELAHRIAEPEQRLLPLRRHRFEARNPVESLIDDAAGFLAFYPPIFRPLVLRFAARSRHITIDIVKAIRVRYAESASLLSVINAVIREWPRPAVGLVATVRGKKRDPQALGLRVTPQARNVAAAAKGLHVIPNMRVPESSPIFTGLCQGEGEGDENLSEWTTTSGSQLHGEVHSSAVALGDNVYAVLSM